MKALKRILLSATLLLMHYLGVACSVCERQQPALLRGITHGTGPDSDWDYLIISFAAAIVVVTLFLSVKWLLRPGERSTAHIKHVILSNE
jgi:hypothetical protein